MRNIVLIAESHLTLTSPVLFNARNKAKTLVVNKRFSPALYLDNPFNFDKRRHFRNGSSSAAHSQWRNELSSAIEEKSSSDF